jgi:serine/threonine-protein kinase
VAVRRTGDDDRPTVDLGPRPEMVAGTVEDPASDDLGPDELHADAEGSDEATRTVQRDIHQQPTEQLPRKRSGSESNTKFTTTASPVEALKLDEIARTRIFLKVALLTSILGAFVDSATGGDPIAFRVVIVGCVVTAIGAGWMLALIRDPAKFAPRPLVWPCVMIAVGAFGGVYYWGCASLVAAMIVYGIYFFSLGANSRLITAMYAVVASMHGLFGAAIVAGLITDRGIVHMPARTLDQIGAVAIIEFLYAITFFTARVSQRVTLGVVRQLEQAVRGMAQREALLSEARADLDRALKVGGPGRFTDQVIGSFRLGVLIGRGGMGEVYEAQSVNDQQVAAVKLLHPGTLADATNVARFIREAETSARLDCAHVVRVLEVGTTTGEVPFLAMERLRGYDLAAQLRRQRRLQLPQADLLVQHVAVGLETARAAGIVHRDLKPHNVFCTEGGGERIWKILDFGVSKVGGHGTLTKGHVVGTPAYMAPEQARGEDVDHRADVYSLAAILYRAVTGHPAFTGKDVPTTLYDVVYRVPTQPSMLAQLPGDIDRVLAIGLAKDPRDRFANARELATWFSAAVRESLTAEQRQRADDLSAKHPWGTRLGAI